MHRARRTAGPAIWPAIGSHLCSICAELTAAAAIAIAIADKLGLARSTVARWLTCHGIGKQAALEPREPPERYQRDRPGEMIHIDIKKLGRFDRPGHRVTGVRKGNRNKGAGWDFVQVAIDDATRLAHVGVLADERKETATAFLIRALAWFATRRVKVERVMTGNGSCDRSKRFGKALSARAIRHIRTRPYTPRTNGKAERFIQTLMREWAYAHSYPSSDARTADLTRWLDWYNTVRPHSALKASPPSSAVNNLMISHSQATTKMPQRPGNARLFLDETGALG